MENSDLTKFDPYYPAIGRAIIAWAALEIKIDELLLSMLSHKNAKATREIIKINTIKDIPKSFRSRLNLCDELAPLFYSGNVLNELKSITKAASGQYNTRNRMAHGSWMLRFIKQKPPQIVCEIRRFGVRGREIPFTVRQITNLTRTYHRIEERLIAFSISHHPDGPLAVRLRQFFQRLNDNRKT